MEQKFDEIKIRLLKFAESQNIPKGKFYNKISVRQSNFGGKSLESSLSSAKIAEILIIFPELNPDWLLTGQGEMLRASSAPSQQAPQPLPHPSRTLPLIPFDAIAGLPSIDNIGIAFPDCQQYLIPEFIARGADYLVRVSGSSMYPKYSNGDLLACQIVHDILFFQWGKIYVIDSSQGVLVKRIFQSDIADHIRLVSDNRDNYPPFDFPTSDIRSIAIVVGVIRFE